MSGVLSCIFVPPRCGISVSGGNENFGCLLGEPESGLLFSCERRRDAWFCVLFLLRGLPEACGGFSLYVWLSRFSSTD